MKRTRNVLAAMVALGLAPVAVPAQAGITINAEGIFLTEPNATISQAVKIDGVTRFGGPGTGFRRFGRDGFFPLPRDETLPLKGRNSFGAAGRKLDDQIKAAPKPDLKDISSWYYLFD